MQCLSHRAMCNCNVQRKGGADRLEICLCAAYVPLKCAHMWPSYVAKYMNLVTRMLILVNIGISNVCNVDEHFVSSM